jgi:hypothetical protein
MQSLKKEWISNIQQRQKITITKCLCKEANPHDSEIKKTRNLLER